MIGRYTQPYLADLVGSALCMMVGLIVVLTAFLTIFFVDTFFVEHVKDEVDKSKNASNNGSDNCNDNNNVSFLGQFGLLRELSLKTWIAIIIFTLMQMTANALYGCMIEPLVIIYGISEAQSNYYWSIVEWVDAAALILFSKLIDNYTAYLESTILMFVTWFIGCLFVLFGVSAIAACTFCGIGFVAAVSSFTVLILANDKAHLTPIVMAFATGAAWLMSILSTNGVGWIYDVTYSYNKSMILLIVCSIVGLIFTLSLYQIDLQKSQDDHQNAPKMHIQIAYCQENQSA